MTTGKTKGTALQRWVAARLPEVHIPPVPEEVVEGLMSGRISAEDFVAAAALAAERRER